MEAAKTFASLSKAKRRQVGAILVTSNGVMIPGVNGTFPGHDNTCETAEGFTVPEVIHAEMNALSKACREGVSTKGAVLYTTLSPCIECAKMIAMAGVSRVVYMDKYRDFTGIDYLHSCHVDTEQLL